MAGRLGHVFGKNNHDTRRYSPRRNPSFAGYDQIPRIPPPPPYDLPISVHRRLVGIKDRLWEITSPNSLQNAFCPGIRPDNLNLRVNFFDEQHRRYDGHMGPFDPTRNPQLHLPGKEWRALIIGPAAGSPRENPEYEVATNCWKSDDAPAFDTGRIHDSYIDKLINLNQEVDRRMEVLHKEYVNHHFLEPSHRALWSTAVRPAIPTSENLDSLRLIRRFPLAVDWIMEAQRGLKDKRAFVDYVSRLQAAPFWMPDVDAEVAMADDRYLGVWLNGMDERLARWYLKERIPCFIAREVSSIERVLLAARERMVDFAAGTSASSIHWGVNDYDSRAITHGDLSLSDTTSFHDPGWVWSQAIDVEPQSPTSEPTAESTSKYEPPPLDVVTIANDRVPWIRPPPVKKAATSRPNAPTHERKRWIKFVENHQPEGTFREVGARTVPDHRTHSMFDRDKRWHIFFLRPPKVPEGCVSDPAVFGQPCPKGTYKGINKKRFVRPSWIYQTLDPLPTDVGRKAPVPKPEDLPTLNKTPRPTPDDDSDSDNDYYPDLGDQAPGVRNTAAATTDSSMSAISMPAAQTTEIEPATQDTEAQTAAIGATSRTEVTRDPSVPIAPALPLPVTNRAREEDEISWGDDESTHEPMGPQIPPLSFTVDSEIISEIVPSVDPLEFASSFLMLYGLPSAEGFSTVQKMITSIAARLHLTVRQVFRVSADRHQSYWFEMESVDQARQMRTHMHHRQENGIELLVTYADYENYVGALARSSHIWPDPSPSVDSQIATPFLPETSAASSTSRRQTSKERYRTRDSRRRSPSPDRYRTYRRPSPLPRQRSPPRSTYQRRRYQRSPSPRSRSRTPYRRSRSPEPREYRPSKESAVTRPPRKQVPLDSSMARTSDKEAMMQVPPLPILPSMPAFTGLPHNAPLPFGANVAFMWSPSGNTFSPVLLQGNTTVLPYPLPPAGPTPSALLPWPVAAALPSSNAQISPRPQAVPRNSLVTPLASRISTSLGPRPSSPPPTPSQPTLMSRMTDHLSARLSDPEVPASLATRLTDPTRRTLVDRLESADFMAVDQPAQSSFISDNAFTPSGGSPPYSREPMDEDPADNEDEGVSDYKRTKRGRRSGQKIQWYRKRDEEREERKRRRRR